MLELIESRICLINRTSGPYVEGAQVLLIQKHCEEVGDYLDLPTPQEFRAAQPPGFRGWLNRIVTTQRRFVYGFISSQTRHEVASPYGWFPVRILRDKNLSTPLSVCLDSYLDFEYCVLVITDDQNRVLFDRLPDGSLRMPEANEKSFFLGRHPGAKLIASTRDTTPELPAGMEMHCHVSFYDPNQQIKETAPGKFSLLAGANGIEDLCNMGGEPVWLHLGGFEVDQLEEDWGCLSNLPHLLRQLVFSRPVDLTRAQVGSPMTSVFDLF